MPRDIDFELIPAPVVDLCRRLRDAGHEAYLVGGGVRDMLMGRGVHDWDVATSARPEQVGRLFRRTIPTGIKHGTVTVMLRAPSRDTPGAVGDDLPVEVTTYRGEGAYTDGRRPDEVRFVRTLEEDLARRDFTINAMAIDPVARALADPVGGEADLARGLLRAVGVAAERFGEDGLRVMRAVRFAAVLEVELEPQTEAAIAPALPVFRKVSAERVRDELLKLLDAPRPSVGLELMRRTGLLHEVLPELTPAVGMKQNRYHPHDVYHHTLQVVDAAPARDMLRLAALLHDVGKPPTCEANPERPGEFRFHGHVVGGAAMARKICERLRLANRDRDRVEALVRHHIFPMRGWSGAGLRRFLRRIGPDLLEDLFTLKEADLQGKADLDERLPRLRELLERLREQRRRQPPMKTGDLALKGGRLMKELGLEPGPRVGELLRALLERVIDDPELNDEQRLLGLARELQETE